ncbi:MAG TPA: hypothetical protein VM434_00605 [Beijerinckiaceae bacterium]|nr:hypothetical protein [Beijerinckiaceae bacterium]
MARAFTQATHDLLAGGALAERALIVVRLPEGDFGFWDDVFSATFPDHFPGVTFTGSGSLISLDDVQQTARQTVQALKGYLSGLDTGVLATLGTHNLHAGTVEIAKALYNPDSRALVAVVTVFRGYIDQDRIVERPGDDGTLVSVLELTCESRAIELDRATHRRRSFADQQRFSAGDRFFEYTGRVGTKPIPWGRADVAGSAGPGR